MDPHWKYASYDYANFFLSLSYLLLTLFGVYTLGKLVIGKSTNWQKLFHFFFVLGSLTRCVFFFLQPFIIEKELIITNALNNLLNFLPSCLFLTTYMILLLLWGEIYLGHLEKVNVNISQKSKPFIVGVHVAMYGTVLVLVILDFTKGPMRFGGAPEQTDVYERALAILVSVSYILISISFFIYGYSLFVSMEENPTMPRRTLNNRKLLRKIAVVALLCMVCFLTRAILVLVSIEKLSVNITWWIIVLYYFGLEVSPLFSMFYVLNYRSQKPKHSTTKDVYSPLIEDNVN